MSEQIKMFIAGEEVVSQNEFTINEEMLSASSTILNNCYPKSWEDNKDYTSNFYYPKDYSKFLLGEGEFLHGLDEYTILKTSGKNLFNSQAMDINKGLTWKNGILFNENKTITTDFLEKNYLKELYSNYFFVAFYYDENKNYLGNGEALIKNVTNATKHTIIPNNASITYIRITYRTSWNNNIDMTTLTDVMLTANASDLTPYMPFGKNISYETNVEKEWNSFNIYGNTYQETRQGYNLLSSINSGSSNSTVSNGNIIFNFSVNQDTYRFVSFKKEVGKTYTLSFDGSGLASGESIKFTLEGGGTPAFSFKNGKNAWVITTSRDDNQFTIDDVNRDNITSTITLSNIMILEGSYTEQTLPPYEPYGAMPSPDYPSELISVGYENLLNVDKSNIYSPTTETGFRAIMSVNNGVIVFNGRPTTSGGTNMFFNSFQVKESGDYRLSTNMENPPTGSSTSMILQKSSDNSNWSTLFEFISSNEIQTTMVSLDKSMYYRLRFYGQSTTIFTNTIFKPMLTKGITNCAFIPYGKYGIEVKINGKNMIDYSMFSTPILQDNGYYKIAFPAHKQILNGAFKENTQYTISFNGYRTAIQSGNAGGFNIYYTDGVYDAIRVSTANPSFKSLTSRANKTISYIDATWGSTNETYIKDLQLEEGTQATTYEEYKLNSQVYILDEPLKAIGQYQDRLYVDNGVLFVERKIGKKIYNGSENWSVPWSNTKYVYQCTDVIEDSKRQSSASSNIICQSNYYPATHYDGGTGSIWNLRANDNYPYLIALGDHSTSAGRVLIKNINYTNTNDFKNWLSTHNVEVNYLFQTPIITPLGYINLPNSYEGINYVNLYTGLDTSMEVYYYWKNFNVLFAGVVKNTGDISLNPRYPHYCNLQILDYKTFLSESNTLDFVIANKTVKEAIGMVVNAISGYGFILGEINIDSADDIIGAYSTLNKTAYDVLQYLANISGSRWRARYVDSSTMAIDFYDPDTLPQGADIEYTQEYWENNNIVDLTFNYGTRDYRNKQILLSDEVYANINYDETLISNGYSNTFTLQNNIGDVVNVVVDGAEKTIGTNNDKQMGVEADFYFTPGKNVIESNSVYSAGTMIHLTYQPLVKGRQIVYNNSEVDRISQQTQTEGVIARYETRNDVLSSDELEKIAKTYIEYKGKAEVILTLRTQNKDLYNIGEVVYFNVPISDLAQNYMVKSKKTEYVVINKIVNLFYIYELTSSFNSEKAINYFDNQRSKATGNIEEGESITRNVDIETQANIIWSEGSVSSATVTVTGDNVLNCALNSPFVE